MTRIVINKNELDIAAKTLSLNATNIENEITKLKQEVAVISSGWNGNDGPEFINRINTFIKELEDIKKATELYSEKIYKNSMILKDIVDVYTAKAGSEE